MGSAKTVVVTPSMVREWGVQNGHTVPARGRLHSTLIDEYNKNNKIKFDSAVKPAPGKMILAKGKRKTDSGKTVPWQKMVSTVEIRQAAITAGIPMGTRGRMSQDIIDAYANNTLDDLAANWDQRVVAKTEKRSNAFQVLAADALKDDEAGIIADGPAQVLAAPADGETVEISV